MRRARDLPPEWQPIWNGIRSLLLPVYGSNSGFMAYVATRSLMSCIKDPGVVDVQEIDPENLWDSIEKLKGMYCEDKSLYGLPRESEMDYLATKDVVEQVLKRMKRYSGKPAVRRAMKSLEKLLEEKERKMEIDRMRRMRRIV